MHQTNSISHITIAYRVYIQCMDIHAQMHVCMRAHTYTCMHMHLHMHSRVSCTYTHASIHVCTHAYTCAHPHTHASIYECGILMCVSVLYINRIVPGLTEMNPLHLPGPFHFLLRPAFSYLDHTYTTHTQHTHTHTH